MPAIDVVPENEPENKLADDAVLEAEPAADAVPQNDPDATEGAADIDNAKVICE